MNKLFALLAVGLLAVAGAILFFRRMGPQVKPPQSSGPVVLYSSFGPANAFSTNRWGAGTHAHADWFVPPFSGRLRTIEIAVDPSYGGKNWQRVAGDLEVFLAQDTNGFPGTVLERFSLAAGAANSAPPTPPLGFLSVAHPKLHAGLKYWLCAKSSGPAGWTWHFGDRKHVQKAARETEPGRWASAGDFCYVGAFSITVTTNADLEAEVR